MRIYYATTARRIGRLPEIDQFTCYAPTATGITLTRWTGYRHTIGHFAHWYATDRQGNTSRSYPTAGSALRRMTPTNPTRSR